MSHERWKQFGILELIAVFACCTTAVLLLVFTANGGLKTADFTPTFKIIGPPEPRPDAVTLPGGQQVYPQDLVFNAVYGLAPAGLIVLAIQFTVLGRRKSLHANEWSWVTQGVLALFVLVPSAVGVGASTSVGVILAQLGLVPLTLYCLFRKSCRESSKDFGWTGTNGAAVTLLVQVTSIFALYQLVSSRFYF